MMGQLVGSLIQLRISEFAIAADNCRPKGITLDLLLEQETGLMIRLADNPETAIVLGSGKSLDELHTLQSMNGFQKRGRR